MELRVSIRGQSREFPLSNSATHKGNGWFGCEDGILGSGGGRGIRTPEGLTTLTVFKTAAFNRSAIPPPLIYPISAARAIAVCAIK